MFGRRNPPLTASGRVICHCRHRLHAAWLATAVLRSQSGCLSILFHQHLYTYNCIQRSQPQFHMVLMDTRKNSSFCLVCMSNCNHILSLNKQSFWYESCAGDGFCLLSSSPASLTEIHLKDMRRRRPATQLMMTLAPRLQPIWKYASSIYTSSTPTGTPAAGWGRAPVQQRRMIVWSPHWR